MANTSKRNAYFPQNVGASSFSMSISRESFMPQDIVRLPHNTKSTNQIVNGKIFDLADVFLSFESMSNKKLQKLCYYAQAWHLALEDAPLIEGCVFEAWVHGPVCPELYARYKVFGYENIPINKKELDLINEEIITFAKDVYEVYGNLSGNELERLSHKESPWIEARKGLQPWESCNNVISEENMKEYYRSL